MHFHPGWEGAVESSGSGRFVSSRTAFRRPAARAATLEMERVAQIRERVRTGYYDSAEAVEALALRLRERGEL